jgi:hypothetical protein
MLTAEQLAEARAMIEAAAGNGHAPASGWAAPAPAASFAAQPAAGPGPSQVSVPIKVPTPNGGSLRVYFAFPGEVAANQHALMNFLAQLANVMPLDVYTPKNNWGGGGGRGYGGGNGGGWGGQRGGW